MLDLLECALEDCERRQRHERRLIAARAAEFAAIHNALQDLAAAGLLVAPSGVQILPRGFDDGRRNEILVTGSAAALARRVGNQRLAHARMSRIAGTDRTTIEVWSHPAGWMLMVEWVEPSAHACNAAAMQVAA